jgi:hypothetical protein
MEVCQQIGLEYLSVASCNIHPYGPSYKMYECSVKDHLECATAYDCVGTNIYLCGDNYRTADLFNTVDCSLQSVKAAIQSAGLL